MRRRFFAATALALLIPAAAFAVAAPSDRELSRGADGGEVGVPTAASDFPAGFATGVASSFQDRDGDDCGRGHAWGCRRKREERYDDRRDRDRYERESYDRDHDDRERYERARYARERYERERYARERYERERELEYYRHRDRRYSRYDGYPIACIRAGGRVLGPAVLVICVP
jgi:hypothetical protein